jgi:hypothetical protein
MPIPVQPPIMTGQPPIMTGQPPLPVQPRFVGMQSV